MNEYVPKIVSLPGSSLSAEVVLHRTLTKLEHIKSVITIIQWNDDSFACDWSSMKVSELCMAEKVFSMNVEDTLRSEGDA